MLRHALLSLCVRLGRSKDARTLAAEEGWDLRGGIHTTIARRGDG